MSLFANLAPIRNLNQMETRRTRATKLFRTLRPLLAITFLMTALCNSTPASAARVKIDITATVSLVDDPDNLLNHAVAPGDIVTGVYTYDSTAVDSNPLVEVADYRYTTAPNGIQLHVNGLIFATDPGNVDLLIELVDDYQGRDNFALLSYNNLFAVSAPGPFTQNLIDWQLDDPTQTALSSVALPRNPPVLSNWQSIFGLNISSMGESHFLIRANVTSAVKRRR